MELLKVILLGVVEGITEFLPISSTGHLILFGSAINFDSSYAQTFDFVVQGGAVLAVVWDVWRNRSSTGLRSLSFRERRRLLASIFVGVLPAIVAALAFEKTLKAHFLKPWPVAGALIAGGLAMLLIDRRSIQGRREKLSQITLRDALLIGCWQVLALFPGTSRSAAAIIGGMMAGLSRPLATQFSFLLEVPLLTGSALYQA